MKILVMGAGYVGMPFIASLKAQSHEIYLTTTKKQRIKELESLGCTTLLLKPDENSHLKEVIDQCDGMVVLVAPNSAESYKNTYLKTAQVVTTILKDRVKPFHLVYTGSTSVCKGVSSEWVTEETLLSPKSENAKVLLESEKIYLECPVDCCVLRLGGIYGPGRDLFDRAKRFSGQEMSSSGHEPTNHIHLEDIVSGLNFVIRHRLKGIYHLVSDEHTTRKKLYNHLCQEMKIRLPVWKNSDLPNTQGVKVANEKIKKAGFVFKHPLILS